MTLFFSKNPPCWKLVFGVLGIAAISFAGGVFFASPALLQAKLGVKVPGSIGSSQAASLIISGEEPLPQDISLPTDFKNFWVLWRLLKEKHYQQPVDEKKMFYGAMNGMASALGDPYTMYFEPQQATEFTQSLKGEFVGIGAEIAKKDDQLQVVAPLADSPAERAGIRAGDFILKIDKQDTLELSVEKAVSLIRGTKGTQVTLQIGRFKVSKDSKGHEKKTPTTVDITITRDTIIVKSVRVKYLRDKVALIEITHFNEDTADLFVKAVDEILKKGTKGVVLDLRNDPGGFLDRATAVAGEWVGDQVVVMQRQRGEITERFHGTGSGRLKGMPTIVLVNQGSASASEIVAGALQDYGMAKLVGMKTFGKGSIQDFLDLPDGSSVKITIAEWLTPKERSMDKQGIQPDVQIDRTQDDYNAERDPQLDRALQLLTGKPALPATKKPGSTSTPKTK